VDAACGSRARPARSSTVRRGAGRGRAAFGGDRVFLERLIEDGRHVEIQISAIATVARSTSASATARCSASPELIEESRRPRSTTTFAPRLCRRLPCRRGESATSAPARWSCCWTAAPPGTSCGSWSSMPAAGRANRQRGAHRQGLVIAQIQVAAGRRTVDRTRFAMTGHVIECRINAEDSVERFAPAPARFTAWQPRPATGSASIPRRGRYVIRRSTTRCSPADRAWHGPAGRDRADDRRAVAFTVAGVRRRSRCNSRSCAATRSAPATTRARSRPGRPESRAPLGVACAMAFVPLCRSATRSPSSSTSARSPNSARSSACSRIASASGAARSRAAGPRTSTASTKKGKLTARERLALPDRHAIYEVGTFVNYGEVSR